MDKIIWYKNNCKMSTDLSTVLNGTTYEKTIAFYFV